MVRIIPAVLCCLAFIGCTKEEDYLNVFRDQQKAWQELTDILAEVRDEKSMAEAKTKLDASFEKFDALSKRAKALPEPSKEIRNRLEKEREYLQQSTENLLREVGRIRKMPGGQEFLNQFEARRQGLMGAVR